MEQVSLIGFGDEEAARLAALLDSGGYQAVCQPLAAVQARVSEEPESAPVTTELSAAFVCGDEPGWREAVRVVRAVHGPVFLVVTTRLPDWKKWLDALEAGASDYCCTPTDAQDLRRLFPRATRSRPAEAMTAKGAA
jgi:DNA-binding NarL/FixJ family response regulator